VPDQASEATGSALTYAEQDLRDYSVRLQVLTRKHSRLQVLSIALGTIAATVGVVAAVIDAAILAVVPGALAAAIAGINEWLTRSGLAAQISAYRSGYVEIEAEIRLYHSGADHYANLSQQDRSAVLASTLRQINRQVERSGYGSSITTG
jgi:hypothetical protein